MELRRNQIWLEHTIYKFKGEQGLETPRQQPSAPPAPFPFGGKGGGKNNSNQEHHHHPAGGRGGNDGEREETEAENESKRNTEREGERECKWEPGCQDRPFIRRKVTPIRMCQCAGEHVWLAYNIPLTRFILRRIKSHVLHCAHTHQSVWLCSSYRWQVSHSVTPWQLFCFFF